jgi:two-component system CheB/CheR fusion protein
VAKKKPPSTRRPAKPAPARRPRAAARPDGAAPHKTAATRSTTAEPDASAASAPEGRRPPCIVAVGASAGGLDAFSQILEHLSPASDLAVVFVQHLSPHHESALPKLLAAKTSLPVTSAADGMQIEANHLYVIPPNVHLEVVDGRLHLVPRPRERSQFHSIDFFFESVARWAQERAIGVILSGTGSDGAAGIREIKVYGGITVAQRPDTAKYEDMPRAAISTGMVDLVLSANEIAEHINHAREHPYIASEPGPHAADDGEPTEHQLEELFSILQRSSGIDFKQYKTPTVKRRLLRRMVLHRLHDVDSYLVHLREHPHEAASLVQDLLIHVTRFFRDPESWKALEALALHELTLQQREEPMRIWVPGCATGEEAFTVAILLAELLGNGPSNRKLQIFATDVSDTAIEQARAGLYPVTIASDVSPERLRRFFTRIDGRYRVSKVIREMCVFARHDLVRHPPFSRLDLVVCRNVLIYLDAPLQKRLMSTFHYALNPRGFLMLGPAETTGAHAPFTLVDKKWRLYRKGPSEGRVALALPSSRASESAPVGMAAPQASRGEDRSVNEEATRLLVEKYGPPGVVVDARFDIVQFRGHTGAYLEAPAGEPSLNVLKMARAGLLSPLRSALAAVRRSRRPIRKEGIPVESDGGWQQVDLEVLPIGSSRGEHFLVLFEAPPRAGADKKGRREEKRRPRSPSRGARDAPVDVSLSDLRQELATSRDYLQSIIQELEAEKEELQCANEEVLSSNEELQSTNEELGTAKEELQSTNEELNTVNEELESRNDELARANSDLLNLLGSVDLPIVIAAGDLSIRRFTPAAERLFNLIATDVGRSIVHIKTNLRCDLDALIRRTMNVVEPQLEEVQDVNGRWYSLRVRPYRDVDNRIDGVVITAFDVDAAKRYEQQVERSREYFMKIVETVKQPLLVLDSNLRVRTANKSFHDAFQTSPDATDGALVYELDHLPWREPETRKMLKAAAAGETVVHFPIGQTLAGIGAKRVLVTARGFELEDATPWVLVALEIVDAEETR